jgi:alpha-L-fucosidase
MRITRRTILKKTGLAATGVAIRTSLPAQIKFLRLDGISLTDQTRMQWWEDAKFGLFLHWGLYSVAAGEWKGKPVRGAEYIMLYERIPLKEYATLAGQFNPTKFNADEWVQMAKDTGMGYLVITTKHHEGFAMFDSPSNDYSIVKRTPYAKDPMRLLADACHKHGLKLGFYYSLGRDWADPDVPTNWPVKGGRSNTWDFPDEDGKVFTRYFERKVKPQVRELLTQYGPVAIMWFDTPEAFITVDESRELKSMIRQLQPACIVNNRIGNHLGDFETPEQKLDPPNEDQPWEACMTMGKHWGYVKDQSGYKSPEVLIRDLVSVVSRGGNLLLDIGPTPEGDFPSESKARLRVISEWMSVSSQAIIGSKPWEPAKLLPSTARREVTPPKSGGVGSAVATDAFNDATSQRTEPEVRFTTKGSDVFLFAMSWMEPKIAVEGLSVHMLRIRKIEMLGSHDPVSWNQDEAALVINMPKAHSTEIPIYVFRLGSVN